MTELSEATLNSLLSTVEALKAVRLVLSVQPNVLTFLQKLAEHKAERDRAQEEWKSNPSSRAV
jgi:hypothetical protein